MESYPDEGEWVSSKITESYVKYVKSLGFNSVRIPCGWVWAHLSDREQGQNRPCMACAGETSGWMVCG
jgi:aryl-phospho-beta-D-glucosidase BglC (GH1 family)